jgi:Diacylglycerol acyltransferase
VRSSVELPSMSHPLSSSDKAERKLRFGNHVTFNRMIPLVSSHLVPVYGFGENDLYRQLILNPPGSIVRRGQRWLQKTTGMVPVFFCGRGIFNYSIGWMPHRHAINVVGKLHQTSIEGVAKDWLCFDSGQADTCDTKPGPDGRGGFAAA